jgi:predicted enzyme related to lactoylglutathione lyase
MGTKIDVSQGGEVGSVAVRYIVDNVDAAVEFYEQALGFTVELRPGPGFAALSKDGLRLLLNEPGMGGAGIAGEEEPQPGGWNRIQLEVDDLSSEIERLGNLGAQFRGDTVEGRGGRQILIEDPAGNPIELFEPYSR